MEFRADVRKSLLQELLWVGEEREDMAGMDQVELAAVEPVTLDVVDVKVDVGWRQGRLYWAQIDTDNVCIRKTVSDLQLSATTRWMAALAVISRWGR